MHRLAGPLIKTERAKEHVSHLEREIRTFFDSKPYEVRRYAEADTGYWSFRLHVHRQPPLNWTALIGDTIHNLRSALDLLACQLVLNDGGTVTQDTAFPISRSAQEFESSFATKIKGASPAVVSLMKGVQAHKGGNETFWRLHRLDIFDKHQLLIPVGSAFAAVVLDFAADFQFEGIKPMPIAIRPADRQFPLKDGAELFRAPMLDKAHMNPQFTFEVAFGEGQVIQGEPIIPTLQEFIAVVQATIGRFATLFSPLF